MTATSNKYWLKSFIWFLWQKRKLQLSPEHCSDFYADQYGTPHFPRLTAFMSSGPIIAMVLVRDDAISYWKDLIGPGDSVIAKKTHPDRSIFTYLQIFICSILQLYNLYLHFSWCSDISWRQACCIYIIVLFFSSLRAKYGTSDLENAVHGSESLPASVREIKFMFPNSKWLSHMPWFLYLKKNVFVPTIDIYTPGFLSVALIEPVPSKEEVKEYLNKNVNPTLLRGLTEVCKHKPFNPCVSLPYFQNNSLGCKVIIYFAVCPS